MFDKVLNTPLHETLVNYLYGEESLVEIFSTLPKVASQIFYKKGALKNFGKCT